MVSVNELVDIVAHAASKTIYKRHDLTKPQGVRGRNSNNIRLAEYLNWTPQIALEDGLAAVYEWIKEQVETR
jgi:nucleoside-diphosphate-sugar epimerase